jgi:hypothetical protein
VIIICGGMLEFFFPPPDSLDDFLSLARFKSMVYHHIFIPLLELSEIFVRDPHEALLRVLRPAYFESLTAILGFGVCFDLIARTLSKNYSVSPTIFILLFAFAGVAKTGYAVTVGVGVGFFSLAVFLRERNIRDLLIPIAAGVALITSCFWLGFGGGYLSEPILAGHINDLNSIQLSIGFWTAPGFDNRPHVPRYWWSLVVYSFLIIMLRTVEVRTRLPETKKVMTNPVDLALLFFILPFIISRFVLIDHLDFIQLVTIPPYLAFVVVLSMLVRIFDKSTSFFKAVTIFPVSTLLMFNFIGSLYYVVQTGLDPSYGPNSSSNKLLAEVLLNVPVKGSLLVTNDLRYPSIDESERFEGHATPLFSTFGHKGFNLDPYAPIYSYRASNWKLEKNRVPTKLIQDQLDIQKLLTADVWPSKKMKDLHRKYGFTHLVIRKDYPHAIDVPLEKLRENSDYAIYKF